MIDALRDPGKCGMTTTREDADAEQAGALAAELGAASAVGAKSLDTRRPAAPRRTVRHQ